MTAEKRRRIQAPSFFAIAPEAEKAVERKHNISIQMTAIVPRPVPGAA
ncbi:MAG: hypothetical protein IRZ03_02995 [Acidobacterium ailaaui]|nr:hypothetical protein [Pseudacidobacterium ailaaui]